MKTTAKAPSENFPPIIGTLLPHTNIHTYTHANYNISNACYGLTKINQRLKYSAQNDSIKIIRDKIVRFYLWLGNSTVYHSAFQVIFHTTFAWLKL